LVWTQVRQEEQQAQYNDEPLQAEEHYNVLPVGKEAAQALGGRVEPQHFALPRQYIMYSGGEKQVARQAYNKYEGTDYELFLFFHSPMPPSITTNGLHLTIKICAQIQPFGTVGPVNHFIRHSKIITSFL